jgi:hypothetical protein
MKNLNSFRINVPLISLNLAALLLAGGCATPEEHSFNQDYGQFLVTEPKYYIADETDDRFRIFVHQGKPSTGAERVIDIKTAAPDIAKAEAQRLGWERWQLNYIQEKDQGWMHVVVAEVKRERYAAPTVTPPPSSQ